jgi:putative ATP-dependent endonuclease of OLD family
VAKFRNACRILPSAKDKEELSFHGRRVRGEIFFARRWILVEGVTEYLLVHALGRAFGWPVDAHGVSVIDFQQSGNPGIYPALATAFGIPWHMVVDGGAEYAKFLQQVWDRGFQKGDVAKCLITLPDQHDLEDQLLADGHEQMLRKLIAETGVKTALTCSLAEFTKQLKNRKAGYMSALALQIAGDATLAARMPKPFVDLIVGLRDGTI